MNEDFLFLEDDLINLTEDLYLLFRDYLEDVYSLVVTDECHLDSDCRIKNEWICPPDVNLPSGPSLGQLRRYCIQTVND